MRGLASSTRKGFEFRAGNNYSPAMFPTPPDAANLSTAELAQIMRWYVDMGVDITLDAEPRDRFADSAAQMAKMATARAAAPIVAAPQQAPRAAPSTPFVRAPQAVTPLNAAALTQEAATQSAREKAKAARNLDELRAALEAFDGCALKRTASKLVFADGNPQARIMLIGDAPGADEDRQGVPFVGRAGQLLDKMLGAIGLDRTQVYIANVVPWRPPGNRTPTPQETAICLPFIRRQIALVNPQVIVCLGAASTQALLGVKDGIMRARGNWFDLMIETDNGERTLKALATLHPAYLLQSPAAKRLVWLDLRDLQKAITQVP